MTRRQGQRAALSAEVISTELRSRIRRKLLRWYDRHKRDLPWRRRAYDPYAQWVAEIMLQQTRVDTVIPYYERFLRRFPTVDALASARHETVVKHWEGLGYYRRVLHLHRAAKLIHKQGGGVPSSLVELRALPGVGEYTAAAIASIAFGEKVAAADGNVARVLARLFGMESDILSTRGKREVQGLASQLLSPTRPGDFNQAWMDLGSAICTPKAPRCEACPIVADCFAVRTNRVLSLPRRGTERAAPRRAMAFAVGVFSSGDRVLMRRRPTGGLWSGLWEFPVKPLADRATPARMIHELAKEYRLDVPSRLRLAGTVFHELTHRSMTFHVYVVHVSEKCKGLHEVRSPSKWLNATELDSVPVSTAHRKIHCVSRVDLDDGTSRDVLAAVYPAP